MKSARLKGYAAILLIIVLSACGGSADVRRDQFMAKGRDFLNKKEYPRAILEFKNASQAKPRDPEPYYQMGMACSYVTDFRCAISAFRKTLQLNPKHFEAQLRLAQLFALTDDKKLLAEAQDKLRALLAE